MQIKGYDHLPEEAKKIREAVFVREQGFQMEFDDIDDIATHLVLFEEKLPVGTCRFFLSDEPDCYIVGRIAVVPSCRGKRYGAEILAAAEREIAKRGKKQVKLAAQCRVQPFYEKAGYHAEGEVFYDEHCPHIWLKKELS